MMRYIARVGKCLTHFEPVDSFGEQLILLALLAVGWSASVAHASSFSWNTLNGQFNNSANWTFTPVLSDLDGIPDANDVVTFRRGSGATYTVTFPGVGTGTTPVDYVSDRLLVGSNTTSFAETQFNPAPSTYTVDNPTTAESGRGMIVGATSADTMAVLTTRLAMLSAVAATIGDVAGSNGTLNVSAGSFNVTGSGPPSEELIVGRDGTGTITANGGDVSVAGNTWVGLNAGSHGTVNVSNANSTWTSGFFQLGYFGGDGTLNVTSGGTLHTGSADIHGSATVATVTGANSTWSNGGLTMERGGTLNISDGGSVATGQFLVGFYGNGTVNVTSGGQLITSNAQLGGFSSSSGYAAVTVAGAGSAWSNFGGAQGPLVIGYDTSPGAINVTDGGQFVYYGPGFVEIIGTGNVSVDGAGSSLTAPTTSVSGMMTVSNGGTVKSDVDVVVGTLKGNGSIAGYVINEGIVAPGNSLGALHITGVGVSGEYTQSSTGRLQIELGGTTPDSGYDQLLVAGNIALDGTLQVSLVSPFSPAFGDSFKILDWSGTLTGQFASVQLPTLSGPLSWDLKQLYTTGVLSVILPGDFNNNGIVDAADYVVWRKGLGTAYTQNDYNVWRTHFGQTASSGAGTIATNAVPEPTTLAMVLIGAFAMCFRRRDAS